MRLPDRLLNDGVDIPLCPPSKGDAGGYQLTTINYTQEEFLMRLTPIDNPKDLMTRLAYRYSKKMFGKVITPMKVVYARAPKSLWLANSMGNYAEKGMSLSKELSYLLKAHTAGLNDCHFCIDIARAMGQSKQVSLKKFYALPDYKHSDLFDEAERAALDFVTEATTNRRVSDECFTSLQQHFTDSEIVEITMLNAIENFYNFINLPLEIESDGLCALQYEAEDEQNGRL